MDRKQAKAKLEHEAEQSHHEAIVCQYKANLALERLDNFQLNIENDELIAALDEKNLEITDLKAKKNEEVSELVKANKRLGEMNQELIELMTNQDAVIADLKAEISRLKMDMAKTAGANIKRQTELTDEIKSLNALVQKKNVEIADLKSPQRKGWEVTIDDVKTPDGSLLSWPPISVSAPLTPDQTTELLLKIYNLIDKAIS